MISDDERREVVACLRSEAKYMRYKQAWYEEDADLYECGNRAYRNIANSVIPGSNFSSDYILVVERLADLIDPKLIDRKTCKNTSGYCDVFECSECRCKAEVISECGNEYGELFNVPYMPSYCPVCGAKVEGVEE